MWIIAIFVVLIVLLMWPRRRIPKVIWTYWHDKSNMPETVQKCIESWRKHCPGWDIRILGQGDTETYRHSVDSSQKHSDFVRLDMLQKHGGVWMDASVFLNGPLDWIYEDPGADFVGYEFKRNEMRPEWPYVENWFMAAPKGSRFIGDWHREFMKYNEYPSVDEYVKNEMEGVDLSGVPSLSYHSAYMSCQKCIQKMGPYNLKLTVADTDGFKHLQDTGWNYEAAAKNFCAGQYSDKKLVKLTQGERAHIGSECEVLSGQYNSVGPV